MIFDQPVAIKQIRFNGNGAQLPMIEVKSTSPRYAVIVISGDLGNVILDVDVIV